MKYGITYEINGHLNYVVLTGISIEAISQLLGWIVANKIPFELEGMIEESEVFVN